MKRGFFLCLMGILMFSLAACSSASGDNQSKDENEKITILTTTAQIGDIAKNIGAEHVEVESLMGPGIDPHIYKATQGDIKKLNDADIIFYNGLNLEGKMQDIFEKMKGKIPTYPVGENVPKEKLLADGANRGHNDPHIWFDISLWIHAVEKVEEGLSKADPDNKDAFKANAAEYITRLKELDQYAKEQISTIPEESRVLVTAHDAFGYFGNAYGMEVKGLQGLNTEDEYGLKDVQNLVDLLVGRDIKAVFVESSISDRSINAVVEGAKKKDFNVVIGGELYSDAMGEEGTETGTYEGMFKHNIDTIVSSLK